MSCENEIAASAVRERSKGSDIKTNPLTQQEIATTLQLQVASFPQQFLDLLMFAQKGVALLKELQRSASVPGFNEELLRATVSEMLQLDASIIHCLASAQDDPEAAQRSAFASKVLIYHTSLQRNKRVALAYIKERLARLENLAWEMGYVPERLKPNLVVAEHEFFSDYCALLHNYTKQFDSSLHIDMTESTKPPNDVFVDVRVKQEIGQIFTEDGAVTLAKGTQLNMRRADAEPLIRQGKLEHIG